MRPSRVKKRWAQGRPALCVTVHLTDPSVAELASLLGFDCIWLDLEHHAYSVETAGNLMRAVRVGTSDVMARPTRGDFLRASRLLEAGAQGILYPRCETVEETVELVKATRFAPIGERGWDGANPDMPYCMGDPIEYVRFANQETFILVQIESPAALRQARAIAEVPGIDGLFFGPGDFSLLSGIPGQYFHESVRRAEREVFQAAQAAGKRFGTVALGLDHLRSLVEMGAAFIATGADILFVRDGYLQLRRQTRELGFEFESDYPV